MPEVVVRYKKDVVAESVIGALMDALPDLVANIINAPDLGGGIEALTATDVEVRDELYTSRAKNAPDLGITLVGRDTQHRRQRLYDLITGIERWLVENGQLPSGIMYFVLPCLVESRFKQSVIP